MEKLVLKAKVRELSQRVKDLRQQDRIPAVVYGGSKKAEQNLYLDFDYQEFRKLFKQAGHNTLVDLAVDEQKPFEVLIYMVDYEPVSGKFSHIDLRRIARDVEITAEVPIKFEGVSEAVKTLSGILVTNKEFIEIKCLPQNLIHEVTADLAKLVDFHSKITVADLIVPKTVIILDNPIEVIATVTSPRSLIEEEAPATATAAVPEEASASEETAAMPVADKEKK